MTEITVHVHVHQEAARAESTAAQMPVTVELQGAPALEWSPTLCDGESVSYEDAEKAIAALGEGWRMPTRREWEGILDHERHDPMMDPAQHPGVESGYHWTSTPCPWAPESAVFVVDTDDGFVVDCGRGHECFVRAVRAVPGQ